MKLFKLTGNSSKLELRLEHPIHLDGNYSIGLNGFYSDNFVKNIDTKLENCFGFTYQNFHMVYSIETDYYDFEDLKKRIVEALTNFKTTNILNFDVDSFEMATKGPFIEITCPVEMEYNKEFAKLVGFEPPKDENTVNVFTTKKGKYLPKIRPFDVIEIHCNLVESSIENHKEHSHLHHESDILYSFYPNVKYGSKISEKPKEIDYIPIKNINKIQNIIITIQDGEGHLLNNDGIKNIVYLRLRKISSL